MSLLDRNLTASVTGSRSNALAGGHLRWRSSVAGGGAALLSMMIIALPALLAWVASAESTVEWTRALSFGSNAWLLANGADLTSGTATISLMPWLLTAIPLVAATIAARRILVQLDGRRPSRLRWCGGLRRDVAEAALSFVFSYGAVGLAVAVATHADPLRASMGGAVLGTVVVSSVSMLLALAFEFRGDFGSVAPGLAEAWQVRLSIHLRRGIGPGLWGALAIFFAGLVLTVAVVIMNLDRIGRLYDTLGADPVGISVLSLGQFLLLPNVALWAASWMAGPGFSVGGGTGITWSQSSPGLLPAVPGLGALPDPGPLPPGLWLCALVPVAAGVLVGWRALRVVARLSSWQVKAKVAASACVVSALLLTLASALAGGSLGAAQLSGVGAPSLVFGVVVLGELLLGAAVVVGVSHVRTVRR